MRKNLNVYVVVPFYNNGTTIQKIVEESAHHLPVVAVDDGSTDQPPALKNVITVRHHKNMGKGAAIRTGATKAKSLGATHIITIDGDGQHFPGEIPLFIEAIKKDPDAIWLGAREMKGENIPAKSHFGRRWSNFWIWFHTQVNVADALSGFRLYPVEAILDFGAEASGYEFESESLILWGWAGKPIKWLTVSVTYAPHGERISHFKIVRDNFKHTVLHLKCFPKSMLRRLGKKHPDSEWIATPRGTRLGYSIFKYFISLFGRHSAYLLMRIVVCYYIVFSPSTRINLRNYWKRIYPDQGIGLKHIWRSMVAFGVTLVDRFARASESNEDFNYTVENANVAKTALKSPSQVIFLSAHFGHWDIGAKLALEEAYPICILMHRHEADFVQSYYEKISSEKIRVINVDSGFSAVEIASAIGKGYNVAMHGDRLFGKQRSLTLPFLGTPLQFPTGPYLLASITQAIILPTFIVKSGKDGIQTIFGEPIVPAPYNRKHRDDDVKQMAEKYIYDLERVVKSYPDQWFNFYDYFGDGD